MVFLLLLTIEFIINYAAKIHKILQLISFIVKRLNKTNQKSDQLSSPMIKVSIAGIALGLAVMLISISIVIGFKHEIREKVTGFTAHIHLINFDLNTTFDTSPIKSDAPVIDKIKNEPEIKHIQKFATKPGIIQLETDLQAIVLKGISTDFDSSFFAKHITQGHFPNLTDSSVSNQVLISEVIANKLNLAVGDKLPTYFMQQPIRMRNFSIVGIYNTNLEMYDELYVLCDIQHVQRLNGWKENEITGYEVFINDLNKLEETTTKLRRMTSLAFNEDKSTMRAVPVTELNQQIFDWLELQNVNVYVIIILMILVSGTNMITGLLILILERTQFIGVLKTLGANNKVLQKIFILHAAKIISRGMIIGNIVGVVLILLQYRYHPIKLDAANYYLSHVPVEVSLSNWILINLLAFLCLLIMMVVPSKYVSKIPVAKIMRYD
ncbi:MAG: ABC transporter permease [Salinivirgaceae bacterium]|nr:ABC transporter permease [Salinivirgaceae bacterium]MDD4747605.1 ABC transporter permease [Salinivirgaceae bacterium]MDY0281170.1 ABC transporter permease [Salinivirgaceae bacterium]